MPDYEAGQHAFLQDVPYDPSKPEAWRNGWKDERDERDDRVYYGRYENYYDQLNFGVAA